jgi:protein SCO1/2
VAKTPLALPLLAALVAAACGPGGGERVGARPGIYEATGVVVDVDAGERQALVDHEDVPGLMPAMTMSFDVPDPQLATRLEPGQKIAFRIEFTGKAYRIVDARVIGRGGSRGTRLGISGAAPADEPAPDFTLVDQDGEPVALADLRGRTLLMDFVYTHCTGPCPLLTALHVEVQRSLPPEVAGRVHFVSISLDPARDDPEAMRAYAEARGADLARWSFLTGEPAAVDDVLERYGVGRIPAEGGEIEHRIVTFLVDGEGIVVKRYLGMEHEAAEIAGDVTKLALGAS